MSVLELALKALMQPGNTTLWHQAVHALRNELEQKPVAQYSDIVSDGGMDPRNKFDHSPERETEQEPVAWTTKGQIKAMESGFQHYIQGRVPRFVSPSENDVALYTHPPHREWKSLSDEEIDRVIALLGFAQFLPCEVARAIEAKLKEKNSF